MPASSRNFCELSHKLEARTPQRVAAARKALSSVALVLLRSAHDVEVLLMERAKDERDPWSGHVSLPGGRWAEGDADRLATSIREAREETGIALSREDLLGELDDLSPRTPTYPNLAVRPFVFGLSARPAVVPGPEAARCFWAGLSELRGGACEETFVIAGLPQRLPAIRLGTCTVWGLTHRILTSLLDIWDSGTAGSGLDI